MRVEITPFSGGPDGVALDVVALVSKRAGRSPRRFAAQRRTARASGLSSWRVLSRWLASARRRRVARDLERRMAELDRLDREFGLGAMPTATTTRTRRLPRTGGNVVSAVLVIAVVASVVVFSPAEDMLGVRRLFGFDNQRQAEVVPFAEGMGSFAFIHTQPGTDEPVGYDPCRPIEVLVNPDGAPANMDDLVDVGLANTAAATGLKFVRVGVTDARDVASHATIRRQPVLIMWATPDEVPELAGDVAGVAGSIATQQATRMRYVTGRVILDRDLFATFSPREVSIAQGIVDHELGHLVGLGHVDDPGELMHEHSLERTTYGPGDLEGLARIGKIDC